MLYEYECVSYVDAFTLYTHDTHVVIVVKIIFDLCMQISESLHDYLN